MEGNYLQLGKSTYGLVQAAKSCCRKFTTTLKDNWGFEQYSNSSYLLKRINLTGKVFFIIYFDNCFVVSDKGAVKKALSNTKKHFNVTRNENIEDFVGCNIERKGKQILLSQPDLIKKMITKFESKIKNTMRCETPSPASTHIVRYSDEEEGLTEEEQKKFRSVAGSLLYLLKHSRPELSNSVRELTKVMERTNKAHEKSLYRVIRFVKETKQR